MITLTYFCRKPKGSALHTATMEEEENKRASQGNFGKIAATSKDTIGNFEQILDHIGGWGIYQIRLLFFMWVMIYELICFMHISATLIQNQSTGFPQPWHWPLLCTRQS